MEQFELRCRAVKYKTKLYLRERFLRSTWATVVSLIAERKKRNSYFLTKVHFRSCTFLLLLEVKVSLNQYFCQSISFSHTSIVNFPKIHNVNPLATLDGQTLRASLVPGCRSADGVCTAGTVVVSRLTMGEMEEVDVDHIAADKPSHKVRLMGAGEGEEEELGAGTRQGGERPHFRCLRANARIRLAPLKSSNEIK